MNTRISKACQECRQRKIRCTGERPCKGCRVHNTECVYRHIIRVRKGHTPKPSIAQDNGQTPLDGYSAESSGQAPGHSRHEGIYHSVSATQSTARSGSLQLYYGSSSNFAFLQQLHRSLLLDDGSEIATPGEVQEGGAGLDLFNQRGLFFGTIATPNNTRRQTTDGGLKWYTLPAELLELFLEKFLDTLFHVLSFVREDELRLSARSIFDERSYNDIGSGQRAVTLAILASGAIATEHAEWAEALYKAAKAEAEGFDEIVNLHSVHFSLIIATHHNAMGRPNQSYLHLGSATRKAFAMGLHKDICSGDGDSGSVQQRRTTMWCLYFHECWQSFSLGRVRSVKRSDITCPLPDNEQFISQSTRLLDIAVQGAEMMYGQRRLSLWETWKAAETVHSELRRFAEETGIAFASRHHKSSRQPMQHLTLTTFYYHTILITFRPFLIVAAARQRQRRLAEGTPGSTPGISLAGDEMWLREACRYAVDSSRDQISFILTNIKETDICHRLKYNGFFIESTCAVLLYDSLSNKHTFSHNLEYIKAGLQCLDSMVPGEPVTTAKASIEAILRVLKRKLAAPQDDKTAQRRQDVPNAYTPRAPGGQQQATNELLAPQMSALMDPSNGIDVWNQGIPQMDWGFDVFTTDLNQFFPLDDSYGSQSGLGNTLSSHQYLDNDPYGESY